LPNNAKKPKYFQYFTDSRYLAMPTNAPRQPGHLGASLGALPKVRGGTFSPLRCHPDSNGTTPPSARRRRRASTRCTRAATRRTPAAARDLSLPPALPSRYRQPRLFPLKSISTLLYLQLLSTNTEPSISGKHTYVPCRYGGTERTFLLIRRRMAAKTTSLYFNNFR